MIGRLQTFVCLPVNSKPQCACLWFLDSHVLSSCFETVVELSFGSRQPCANLSRADWCELAFGGQTDLCLPCCERNLCLVSSGV